MTRREEPQGTLWGPDTGYPPPPSTRDPHSREAARSVEPTAGTRRAQVLALVRDLEPVAEWELEGILGWRPNQLWPRIWELEQAGVIEKRGRILNPAGRRTWLYRLVPRP